MWQSWLLSCQSLAEIQVAVLACYSKQGQKNKHIFFSFAIRKLKVQKVLGSSLGVLQQMPKSFSYYSAIATITVH